MTISFEKRKEKKKFYQTTWKRTKKGEQPPSIFYTRESREEKKQVSCVAGDKVYGRRPVLVVYRKLGSLNQYRYPENGGRDRLYEEKKEKKSKLAQLD